MNNPAPDVLSEDWDRLMSDLEVRIGKRPADVNSILFLIGVQELGKGPVHFSKEQKQDLMHIGTCHLLSLSGHYNMTGLDKDGWPHYTLVHPIPQTELSAQEDYLKAHILLYFSTLFNKSL